MLRLIRYQNGENFGLSDSGMVVGARQAFHTQFSRVSSENVLQWKCLVDQRDQRRMVQTGSHTLIITEAVTVYHIIHYLEW